MPSEVRFADVRKKLEHHGWTLERINGSHHHFRGEGREPITIPVHRGRVKAIYVKAIDKAIRALEREEEQGE